MITRRKVVIALGAGAPVSLLSSLLFPLPSLAQPAAKIYRIGFISNRPGIEPPDEAFRQGLRELGLKLNNSE